MSNTPGTVSKILWHFTGGPVWNHKEKKQGKKLKPAKESYLALKSIIKTSELRVGSYHEIVKVIIKNKRIYNKEKERFEDKENFPIVINSSPVCCVAEIPIQHLSYHSTRYGKIAIGFYRDSIVKNGFNPVMYTLEHSHLSNNIYEGYSAIDNVNPDWATWQLESMIDEFEKLVEKNGINETIDFDEVLYEHKQIEKHANLINEKYKNLLAYIKTFESNEFDSIYCEREWRSTQTYKFKPSDIAMIVLPKNVNNFNYYDDFIESDSLSYIDRKTPIVCWEDLIEH